jgi:hypothetical protein
MFDEIIILVKPLSVSHKFNGQIGCNQLFDTISKLYSLNYMTS